MRKDMYQYLVSRHQQIIENSTDSMLVLESLKELRILSDYCRYDEEDDE